MIDFEPLITTMADKLIANQLESEEKLKEHMTQRFNEMSENLRETFNALNQEEDLTELKKKIGLISDYLNSRDNHISP